MKSIFRILAAAMLAACLAASVSISAAAAEAWKSGVCGNGGDGSSLTWTLGFDGTLTVEGNGKMGSYDYGTAPWYEFRMNIKNAVLADGVTSIGECAFFDCTELTSVKIPEGVTVIEGNAFNGCTALESAAIPQGVTLIFGGTFMDCTALTSVSLPNSVVNIGYGAFQSCSGLTSVKFPQGLTNIGMYAFKGCTGLTSVTIPESVESIEYQAFDGCPLNTVYYGGTAEQWNGISLDKDDTENVLLTASVVFDRSSSLPVLSTDIRSFIFGSEIASYNVSGSTGIVAEDLADYGFTVVWDGEARTLSISHPSEDFAQSVKNDFGAKSGTVGEKLTETVPTDIVTYINGVKVESFNIGGQTVIYIDALGVFGSVSWNGEARTISVG